MLHRTTVPYCCVCRDDPAVPCEFCCNRREEPEPYPVELWEDFSVEDIRRLVVDAEQELERRRERAA